MTVDEPRRHALYTRLEHVLGAEHATTFMQLTPPTEWTDFATKHDLEALRVGLEARMDRLEAEMRAEIQSLRAEILGEMQSLRAEILGEMQGLRAEILGEMQRLFRIQTIWLIGVILTFASVIIAASRLL
ncbi:MAG: hypothetical protein EDR02_13380 [Actinobacteria bacterium]|nr:MAG: hypothetical protein EDR02_13380 [Actinomycetota bacterium]RIK02591.1 MAG: hypothetical protein DCC48_17955 [Acidobacteriota bacterium]